MTKQKRKKTTPRQFDAAATKKRIVKATAKSVPGEKKARTALKLGKVNGCGAEDIAHFFRNENAEAAVTLLAKVMDTEGYAFLLAHAPTAKR